MLNLSQTVLILEKGGRFCLIKRNWPKEMGKTPSTQNVCIIYYLSAIAFLLGTKRHQELVLSFL